MSIWITCSFQACNWHLHFKLSIFPMTSCVNGARICGYACPHSLSSTTWITTWKPSLFWSLSSIFSHTSWAVRRHTHSTSSRGSGEQTVKCWNTDGPTLILLQLALMRWVLAQGATLLTTISMTGTGKSMLDGSVMSAGTIILATDLI